MWVGVQMAQLQQHAATQDERLASVLLQLKTQRPAHSIEVGCMFMKALEGG